MARHCHRLLLLPLFSLLFILIRVPQSSGSSSWFSNCSSSFSCGDIRDVNFPFWGGDRPYGCGHPALELTCKNNSTSVLIGGLKYLVREVNSDTQLLRIARQDFLEGICLKKFVNTTLDPELFDLVPGYTNFSFMYGCPPMYYPFPTQFKCSSNGLQNPDGYIFLGDKWPSACVTSVVVPLYDTMLSPFENSSVDFQSVLQEGFEVKLKVDSDACSECVQSNGVCGYDLIANGTTCYCSGQSSGSKSCAFTFTPSPAAPQAQPSPPPQPAKKEKISIGIGIAIAGAGTVGILLGWWLFFLLQRSKRAKRSSFPTTMKDLPPTPSSKSLLVSASSCFSRATPTDPSSKSELGSRSTYFGVRLFSYRELEEATYNFDPSKELGDGGFGTVYYGNECCSA
ncbi:hypothetical protein CRG98_009815 [Punica granatum]|uniref:non-specific serine/threonine protein kinase n=1 Tax=Punica granatum TaxID=22663 RepID=A0A2I0KNM4_PUNGR|nr:hypothetical protein CRG98_009815 [Punica granatum]